MNPSLFPFPADLRADDEPSRSHLMETLDGLSLPATPENALAVLLVLARGEMDPTFALA